MEDATLIKLGSLVVVGGIIIALILTGNANLESIIPMLIAYFLPSPVKLAGIVGK